MSALRALRRRLRRLRRGLFHAEPPVWHHPAYRLPMSAFEARTGVEPRRADFALTALRAVHAVEAGDVRTPERVSWADLARVHRADYLESLHDPVTLARILAGDPHDLVVDSILATFRLACGGTLAAARAALARRGPALNLLGGFHHAGPARGGGLCAVNDIAVAVAALRAEGVDGLVAVLDLDAHPPDGTAECLAGDGRVWIGSLSGERWEALPGVDETVLPAGTGDAAYLAALAALLGRMPAPALAFVVAGGDVLAGDRLGKLGLTLAGARRRDALVEAALRRVPSVWLPGGGYHEDAWKVLAGTGLVLAGLPDEPLPAGHPMDAGYAAVAARLDAARLGGDDELTLDDLVADLGGQPREARLLGFYTASGLEHALARYGLLGHLERLGYERFRVAVDRADVGDRGRLFGRAGGAEHLLIELIVERRAVGGAQVLFVHWLNLRHPRAASAAPLLPGQDVPGLGLVRELGELLERMAARLGLAGVAFNPAHYHLAYIARSRFRFLDPARQGRFEALLRDLAALPLSEATEAVAGGRVLLDGEPYHWEAEPMVDLAAVPIDRLAVATARDAARFTLQRNS